MALYVAESTLRDLTLEVLRTNVPSLTALRLDAIRGPFRLRNWRVDWLDVPAVDYGAARDKADELEAMDHWILVPEGHPLHGQVLGREEGR